MISSMVRRKIGRSIFCSYMVLGAIGCSLGDLVNNPTLPTNIQDPNVVKTPEGAMGAYYSAVYAFRDYVAGGAAGGDPGQVFFAENFIASSGLFTDELQSIQARVPDSPFPSAPAAIIDARVENYNGPYKGLHKIRARAHEAISALRTYRPNTVPALVGHLLTIEGMAEVLLAELYCSGIPLSTLDFNGDYTLRPGSSTEAVFQHALTLFDSALVITIDSTSYINFASIGRARALLGLHDVAAAALAVANVPTAYRYMLPMEGETGRLFGTTNNNWFASVANRKGGVGLPYIGSGDPRSASDSLIGTSGGPWFPKKYLDPGVTNPGANPGDVAVVFAGGIEARLIEAEAALLAGDTKWLIMLNALRTSCVPDEICPIPAPTGTGGVANLPLLPDPALNPLPAGATVEDVRLDLIFRERAYWMFLTGRRQADLRRLVQQYGREQHTVYPSGFWGRQQFVPYGTRISFLVPSDEQDANPLYHGCED